MHIIVSLFSGRAAHTNIIHIHSQQEETDINLFIHAAKPTASGILVIDIHSPDTDVFVL